MTEQPSDWPFATSAELRALAALEPEAMRAGLIKMAQRSEHAEAEAAVFLARQMLAAMDLMASYDDPPSAALIRGVLRSAAGLPLTGAERTAMGFAGLVSPGFGTAAPTDEGRALIGRLAALALSVPGLDQVPESIAAAETDSPPFEVRPFAHLRFGDRVFEIAEAAEEDRLLFRVQGEADWSPLDNTREAGWDVVGAEMLAKSMDAYEQYTRTHVIRLADPQTGDGVHVFELEGLRWWLRIDGTQAHFTTDPSAGWTLVPAEIQAETIRALGIQAAYTLMPGFRGLMETNVKAWLRRMAHAAAVMPVMAA